MSEQVSKVIVGLTGNIATGKSAVMRLAKDLDAETIDADAVVHELMNTNADLQQAIVDAFGASVRRENGRINRPALGKIVFGKEGAMHQLETLIHPPTRAAIHERIKASEKDVVFIEAIKLLEGPLTDLCHQIWVTRCSKRKQLERLRVCRGMSTPDATARIKSQSSQEDKVAMADVVIDTEGFYDDTISQFELAWQRLPALETLSPVTFPDPTKAVVTKPKMVTKAAPSATAGSTKFELKRLDDMPTITRHDDMEVRRARPSDIPSVLLLIQKATDGKKKMTRSDLLMALSERSYFIGQVGTEVTTVIGWSVDMQAGFIDEIFIYPPEAIETTTTAVIEDIEKSADTHICETISVFLPADAPEDVRNLFLARGYLDVPIEQLPYAWQTALNESQPDGTEFLLKVLREDRLNRS